MISTVMQIDERKDRYEAHHAVGEESLQKLSVSVQSIRRWPKDSQRSYGHAARDRRQSPATRTANAPVW